MHYIFIAVFASCLGTPTSIKQLTELALLLALLLVYIPQPLNL